MNKQFAQSILRFPLLIVIALSSGCGSITDGPSATLTPTPSQTPTNTASPSPISVTEAIHPRGTIFYSDFNTLYSVDLKTQQTEVIFQFPTIFSYQVVDNFIYVTLFSEASKNEEIFRTNLDGTQLEQITTEGVYQIFEFDPIKKYLTYHNKDAALMIFDVNAKRSKMIAKPSRAFEWIFPLSWSPDGTKLFYSKFIAPDSPTSTGSLFSYDVEKNESTALLSEKAVDSFTEWSPDGKNIALTLESNNQSGVYIFNIDTGILKQIPVNEQYSYFEGLSWSTNGEKLIFSTGKTIYLFDLITNKLEVIAQYSDIAIGFVPSPDKNMILYEQSNRTCETDLYLFDMLRKRATKIYSQQSILEQTKVLDKINWHYSSTWAPDGKYFIYFSTSEPDNYSITNPRPITLNIYSVEMGSSVSFEVPTTSGYMVSGTYWTYLEQ